MIKLSFVPQFQHNNLATALIKVFHLSATSDSQNAGSPSSSCPSRNRFRAHISTRVYTYVWVLCTYSLPPWHPSAEHFSRIIPFWLLACARFWALRFLCLYACLMSNEFATRCLRGNITLYGASFATHHNANSIIPYSTCIRAFSRYLCERTQFGGCGEAYTRHGLDAGWHTHKNMLD